MIPAGEAYREPTTAMETRSRAMSAPDENKTAGGSGILSRFDGIIIVTDAYQPEIVVF